MTTSYIQGALLEPEVKKVLEAVRTDCLTNGTNASAVQADLDATTATIITDLGVLRTAIVYLLGALDTVTTKLNADAGVTDVNYVTTNASGHTPAAITTTV